MTEKTELMLGEILVFSSIHFGVLLHLTKLNCGIIVERSRVTHGMVRIYIKIR
jgi:hypothetical protein